MPIASRPALALAAALVLLPAAAMATDATPSTGGARSYVTSYNKPYPPSKAL